MRDFICAGKLEGFRTDRRKSIVVLGAASLLLAGCGGRQPTTGQHKPADPGPDQQVHLKWKQATSEWMVQLPGQPEKKPADAHTDLANTTGPTKFVVDIQGTPVSFKDPGGLDVWEGDGKKSQPQPGINSTQILGPIVTKNGKQLIFYDLNQDDPVTLNYRLNFDSGPSVDPIIDNGGHNRL